MGEDVHRLRQRRLQLRAAIRAHNHMRPRCSGCGGDMLMYEEVDFVTEELLREPGFDYLLAEDFRPGDLICFWCIAQITNSAHLYEFGTA